MSLGPGTQSLGLVHVSLDNSCVVQYRWLCLLAEA